ncbi:D-alanine--D-alanine ligase [Thalassotalea crassostreae]|uniref:D-alanine--D-alanine ligase n=1 Tax=Thalassotalea crassostreae TaxID=1763536 RepID=UPI0008390F9E|nr:D-alanine--D-alanine ligase [Thalassotalea crassostreae]
MTEQLLDVASLKQEKLVVLYGGDSAEREVSLQSGFAIFDALKSAGFNVTAVDTQGFDISTLKQQNVDRAFIALHGRGGEDGCIQGALEYLQIPYTGSGVLGSALSMDKVRSKQIFSASNLPTANYAVVNAEDFNEQSADKVLSDLGHKVMVKPANEGSSIGMAIANNTDELNKALIEAFKYDQQVLVEAWLSGREFTVAVVGDEAFPAIEMVTPHEFYDYQAKYQSKSTEYHCPCALDSEREGQLRQLALKAFRATGASGWGRVDVMQDEHGNFNLLEVNTVPGMTVTSLVPKAAKVAGYDFQQLVTKVLQISNRLKG